EGELALRGELRDRDLRERLADRTDIEPGVGTVRHRKASVGEADGFVEEGLAVTRDQRDARELAGGRAGPEQGVGRRGDLRVGPPLRLVRGAGTLGPLEPKAQDSVGRTRFEPQADLEPVARLLRARQKRGLAPGLPDDAVELERADVLRHVAKPLDSLLERDLLERGYGEVGRDEGAEGVRSSHLEGREQGADA